MEKKERDRNRPWRQRCCLSPSLREKKKKKTQVNHKITGRRGLGGRDVSPKSLEEKAKTAANSDGRELKQKAP